MRWCVATKLWMCRMSFSEIFIVAFALAVDALVCSIITGKSSTNRLSRIITGPVSYTHLTLPTKLEV